MKYIIILLPALLFFISCSHTPKKQFPTHSSAILSSNRDCLINFFNANAFSSDDKIIVTYLLDDSISPEEKNIYKEIYNLIHIYLSNNNIQVIKLPDFVNEKIDYDLLNKHKLTKIIKFSIDNIGVKFSKFVNYESGIIGLRGNLERKAFTSIYFQIINAKTSVIEYSNYVDGNYADVIPRKERKNLQSHEYIYYPQKIEIYKTSDEIKEERRLQKLETKKSK